MLSHSFRKFALTGLALTVLALGAGFIWQSQLPVGNFIDWAIAIASFWWLIVIVRFPWDIHFQAREVVHQTAEATSRGIAVNPEQRDYAQRWVKWSLVLAISLHLVSAAVLFILAFIEVSVIGYIGSGVALLLTGLRPLIRGYQHINQRLNLIKHQTHYPREDVVRLRAEVEEIQTNVEMLQQTLRLSDQSSWAAKLEQKLNTMHHELGQLNIALQHMRQTNQAEHQRLARDTEHAVAKITADGMFLDHVREIIRFVKAA